MDDIPHCIIRNNRIIKDGEVIFDWKRGGENDFMLDAYSNLGISYPKFYKMDRLAKLGLLGSEVLLPEAKKNFGTNEIGIVLSNANSSLDTDLRYWETVKTQASPSLFVYTLPNIVAGEICIRHGIKGENLFFVSPQFDSELISSYVEILLKNKNVRCCLAGWVDVLNGHIDVFLYLTDKPIPSSRISELYHPWSS